MFRRRGLRLSKRQGSALYQNVCSGIEYGYNFKKSSRDSKAQGWEKSPCCGSDQAQLAMINLGNSGGKGTPGWEPQGTSRHVAAPTLSCTRSTPRPPVTSCTPGGQ